MSLFRTLQHSPATLTIFHDATIPLSNILYKALSRAHFNLKDNSKHEFQIDLMQNKMPTLDQYQSLVRNCLPDSRSKSILHGCYPFLHDRRTLGSSHSEIVTTRGLGHHRGVGHQFTHHKTFSEGEYSIIYDAFNKLHEGKATGKVDIEPSEIFRAPLVVDWDQNKIANDEESLVEILQKYTAE